MKKIMWFLKKLFGKKYFIKYIDELEEDEILIVGHKIYLKKGKEER